MPYETTDTERTTTVEPNIDLATLVMRVAMGGVLIHFGMYKVIAPGAWAMFLPSWVLDGLGAHGVARLLTLHGLFETALGVQLCLGLLTRATAALTSAMLLAIVVQIGLNPIGVRDFGLMGLAVGILSAGPGRWSIDNLLARGNFDRTTSLATPRLIYGTWCLGLLGISGLVATLTDRQAPVTQQASTTTVQSTRAPITPIEEIAGLNREAIDLGRLLFHDKLLSRNETVSCASCHSSEHAGADGRIVSVGVDGRLGTRNAPTVLNAGLHIAQFWDGRSPDLEDQARHPVTNPHEMDNDWPVVVERVKNTPRYRRLFARIYPKGVTEETIRAAIAEFQRSLTTPDSPFDQFLRGDTKAITAAQRQGYELFLDLGCVSCHQGAAIGGNTYQTMGKMRSAFPDGVLSDDDLGRYQVTGDPADRYRFKVPSLRNVARTAPYFHNGSVATLDEAVSIMARYQLGYELPQSERTHLVAFLQSLNGQMPPF